jgi:spore coat polysaccharide biosynthesis protein SpsF
MKDKNYKPKVAAIVEVRMTSSRLPGKHLLESNGLPMVSRLVRRIRSIESIDLVILATTQNPSDDVFISLAEKEGVAVYRGSESDVMGRVLQAAIHFSVDIICEITGDCPLIDVDLTNEAIKNFFESQLDYLNNGTTGLPDGLGCQIFLTKALETSYNLTNKALDFEHVTAHIIRNPLIFNSSYTQVPDWLVWPSLSLSLDEEADFFLLNEIISVEENSDFLFGARKIIDFLRTRPDLVQMNEKVVRRGYE